MTEATKIKVNVITQSGDEHEIETPTDIKAGEFCDEVVQALDLPRNDADGAAIAWRMDNKDTARTLDADKTLDENGVQDKHSLQLIRQVVAGAATV